MNRCSQHQPEGNVPETQAQSTIHPSHPARTRNIYLHQLTYFLNHQFRPTRCNVTHRKHSPHVILIAVASGDPLRPRNLAIVQSCPTNSIQPKPQSKMMKNRKPQNSARPARYHLHPTVPFPAAVPNFPQSHPEPSHSITLTSCPSTRAVRSSHCRYHLERHSHHSHPPNRSQISERSGQVRARSEWSATAHALMSSILACWWAH